MRWRTPALKVLLFPYIIFTLFCQLPPFPELLGPRFTIEVRNGERIKDFSRRLEEQNLLTPNSLNRAAGEMDFSEYPHVPAPRKNMNRFEGLFIPGEYTYQTSRLQTISGEDKYDAAEEKGYQNARYLLTYLLAESIPRYRNLKRDGLLNGYEKIILASIVEKEAASNRDYPQIASVFYNRLNGNHPLGSCPTVEYALGYHRPFLTYDDIAINSPYNVYKRRGLPPTPICFFSSGALAAIENPPETDLLFFVYDWTNGELYFTGDYEEHKTNAGVARNNYIYTFGYGTMRKVDYSKFYER